jgi:hypothetical protein
MPNPRLPERKPRQSPASEKPESPVSEKPESLKGWLKGKKWALHEIYQQLPESKPRLEALRANLEQYLSSMDALIKAGRIRRHEVTGLLNFRQPGIDEQDAFAALLKPPQVDPPLEVRMIMLHCYLRDEFTANREQQHAVVQRLLELDVQREELLSKYISGCQEIHWDVIMMLRKLKKLEKLESGTAAKTTTSLWKQNISIDLEANTVTVEGKVRVLPWHIVRIVAAMYEANSKPLSGNEIKERTGCKKKISTEVNRLVALVPEIEPYVRRGHAGYWLTDPEGH